MFHLMAYSKDQDRYDKWQSGTLQEIQAEALFCQSLLRSHDLIGINNTVYDWLEIWNDENKYGQPLIVLPDKLCYRGNYYDGFDEIKKEED